MSVRILTGDALTTLRTLEPESVHCVVTSPPYWGLRNYNVPGQLGLERTPEEYVGRMVDVFREVRRVLRTDGTLWLNMGDCYHTVPHGPKGENWSDKKSPVREMLKGTQSNRMPQVGLKSKDLVGVPWRLAFALQADGWWLRSDIIWHKPNPMPESIRDRPTKAHEYLFLLSKAARYYYDADAVKEEAVYGDHPRNVRGLKKAAQTPGQPPHKGLRPGYKQDQGSRTYAGFNGRWFTGARAPGNRNLRTVWTIPTSPFPGAHFATFPPALVEPCIKAGCPEGGVVLDPFAGAGTVGLVADRLQRSAILIELNPEYVAMARRRIYEDAPMLVEIDCSHDRREAGKE